MVDDVILDKDFGRRARKLLGEVDDYHVVDAEFLEFLKFFLGRAEKPQVGAVDVEHLTRMGLESDHNRLSANALRQAFHLVENGLVPKVNAIEGADGDHGVGDVAGFYDVSEYFHK